MSIDKLEHNLLGNPDQPPPEDPRERAAVTIQTAIRGYFARREFGHLKLNQTVKNCTANSGRLVKHLIAIAEKVEKSWRSGQISQDNEIAALDQLKKIKEELTQYRDDLGQRDRVNPARYSEVKDFEAEFTKRLLRHKSDLQVVCQKVGFQNLKKGLKITLGKEWKSLFSSEALALIEQFHILLNPTGYEVCPVKNQDGNVFLERSSGGDLSENPERIENGVPYFTGFRVMSEANAREAVHGGELFIPVKTADGTHQMVVIKGTLNSDPINAEHHVPVVEEKMKKVKAEFEEVASVPDSFKEAYLVQYPVRDLLLNEPGEIKEELLKDYELTSTIGERMTPSFVLRFARVSIAGQMRIFSLLLMNENTEKAVFLYDLTAKKIPEYQDILRNNLHFSLQRKLDLALDDYEEMKKKLKQLKADQTPMETRIALSKMPDEVKAKAFDKLKQVQRDSSESDKAQKYLEGIVKVPFKTIVSEPVTKESPPSEISEYLDNVKKTLDDAVHGHDKSKQAIMEWLAQRISNGGSKGECIALEGPPGTGKTTFAKEGIAKALGRPFAFIAMGGQSDASFLTGHGYTYIGSDWGRIVDLLIESKCMNPVIYIDEVDKVSQTEKGKELVGVLQRLTDFSQNKQFHDNYFSGVDFDLSQALFVFSYNDPSMLDPIFRDRLQRIKVEPLTLKDKLVVTKSHLMPDILKSTGFKEGEILIDDETVKYIAENYTFEAGARRLKENLFSIVRQMNLKRLRDPDSVKLPYTITKETVIEFRDSPKIEFKRISDQPHVGMVNGLYATNAGIGGLTIIQAYKTLGKERLELILTGSQGDVMKESMTVARSVAWNLIPEDVKDKVRSAPPEGIHIHTPEGATPKDGPSAGGAITTALISQLTGIPVKNDVAMTGEIDLTGRITTIGGLGAKLAGAKKAGVRLALVPRGNEKDLEKIKKTDPDLLDDTFEVKIMDTIYDILDHALVNNPIKKPEGPVMLTEPPPSGKIVVVDGEQK